MVLFETRQQPPQGDGRTFQPAAWGLPVIIPTSHVTLLLLQPQPEELSTVSGLIYSNMVYHPSTFTRIIHPLTLIQNLVHLENSSALRLSPDLVTSPPILLNTPSNTNHLRSTSTHLTPPRLVPAVLVKRLQCSPSVTVRAVCLLIAMHEYNSYPLTFLGDLQTMYLIPRSASPVSLEDRPEESLNRDELLRRQKVCLRPVRTYDP